MATSWVCLNANRSRGYRGFCGSCCTDDSIGNPVYFKLCRLHLLIINYEPYLEDNNWKQLAKYYVGNTDLPPFFRHLSESVTSALGIVHTKPSARRVIDVDQDLLHVTHCVHPSLQ